MGDGVPCRGALAIRRDDTNITELGGDLGEHADAWAIHAVVVRDEDSHDFSRAKSQPATARLAFATRPRQAGSKLGSVVLDVRIALFHNEDAGDGSSVEEIRALLERHGHHLVQVVDEEWSAEQILDKHADLVVAAGGDGTVATAARVLAGRKLPLAILPMGTANNIAKSLCCEGPLAPLIEGWAHAEPQSLDLGIARGDWGERIFFESVGAGLIPAGIAAAIAAVQSRPTGNVEAGDAVRTFRDVLSRMKAQRWTITLDGQATSGDFLLVEVLNMPSIGPNLVLSDEANPSDGFFSVVATERPSRRAR